jgi:ring-1,2-phenylacetyl-CoA epoxidase subunit PaaD
MTALTDVERVAWPRPEGGAARRAWDLAALVRDPEIPALTLEDLGVLRRVAVDGEGRARVEITPTYSGCPGVTQMRDDIVLTLGAGGFPEARVTLVLAPAWSTDWISEVGRRKLADYGIAPPRGAPGPAPGGPGGPVPLELAVRCPQCASPHTRQLTRFGSTACKALHRCEACREPFDYFKELK